MTTVYEIKDLSKLLDLSSEEAATMSYVATSLLGPGENFGSTMLAVDVTLTRNGEKTTEHYVAKLCPPNELLKELFDTQVTYRKEILFYSRIAPLLQQFQSENGDGDEIDFFPRMYGARINLDPASNLVDEDAVLLLENLKHEGYELVDRMVGFDLSSAEFLIKKLAVFHAVPLALKLKQRDIFEKEILGPVGKKFKFAFNGEFSDGIVQFMIKCIKKDASCAQYVSRAVNGINNGKKYIDNMPEINDVFGTLIHNDLWVNNTMIKYHKGKPEKCVMVDFQVLEYGSPADDVIFFLFTSVQKCVLEDNLDKLINLYYTTFMKTLEGLSCDTSQISFQLFEEELMHSANNMQFLHIIFWLMPILTKKGVAKELKEFKETDMLQDETTLAADFPERLCYVVSEFAKRNWI